MTSQHKLCLLAAALFCFGSGYYLGKKKEHQRLSQAGPFVDLGKDSTAHFGVYSENISYADGGNLHNKNSVLLGKTAKISMWSRTNYVPPYGMVRVAFFLKDYDAAKSKCSNDKTMCEDGLRTMRLIYHYHPLSVDDSRMCKGIDFHVGQRTSLVVVPNNLRCGEIPLLYQKVRKGEPIDY